MSTVLVVVVLAECFLQEYHDKLEVEAVMSTVLVVVVLAECFLQEYHDK